PRRARPASAHARSRRRSCAAPPAGEPAMSDLVPLAQARCTPRRGREHQLGEARIRELLPQDPGWELAEDGRALVRTLRSEDHHPDLGVHYDRCVVRWSTHDVGGLSENDFICAAKASALAG